MQMKQIFPCYMRDYGATLADNGYRVVPLWPGRKYPAIKTGDTWRRYEKWTKHCDRENKAFELKAWSNWDGCGVGIACGETVVAVDIDLKDDAELANKVQQLAEARLGVTPAVRIGQWPKTLLVYRAKEKIATIKRHPIEVLGHGAQFVAYGIHPDTEKPYQWIDEGLADLHVKDLPAVTQKQLEDFVEKACALLPEDVRKRHRKRTVGQTQASPLGATASLEAVRSAVEAIPNPDLQWDDWSRIGMAIWAATGGSEEGAAAFEEWSAKSSKHNAKACRERWQHWFRSPPSKLGFGTLFHEAKQNGWTPPANVIFDKRLADLAPASPEALIERARTALPAEKAPPAAYSVPEHLLDLDGGLKTFVDWCVATAPTPQPFFALAAALPMFRVLTARKYRTRTDLRGSLFTVALGDSGSGKDHPRKCVQVLLSRAGLGAYLGGDDIASGQAILSALARHPALLFRSDEFGKHLATWADRRAPGHKAAILTKLTELFSAGNGVIQGTEYANPNERPRQDVVQPCACLMGSTVPGTFWKALQEGAMSDGSVARFLIFRTADNYPTWKTELPLLEPPEALVELCKTIVAGVPGHDYGGDLAELMLPEALPKPYVVKEDSGAQKIFRQCAERRLEWCRQVEGQYLAAFPARLWEHTVKLAMVRAVARQPAAPVITEHDAQWAWDLTDHCLNTLLADAERHLAENQTEADKKKLLQLIRSAGENGITNRVLSRKTMNMDSWKRKEHLDDLQEGGFILQCDAGNKTGPRSQKYYAA